MADDSNNGATNRKSIKHAATNKVVPFRYDVLLFVAVLVGVVAVVSAVWVASGVDDDPASPLPWSPSRFDTCRMRMCGQHTAFHTDG